MGNPTPAGEPLDPQLLPLVVAALDHPLRLRVVAALQEERKYVSALARELGISRPLLYLHLERLERAGLVTGSLELGEDGKAVKWYALRRFDFRLTPEVVAAAAQLTPPPGGGADSTEQVGLARPEVAGEGNNDE